MRDGFQWVLWASSGISRRARFSEVVITACPARKTIRGGKRAAHTSRGAPQASGEGRSGTTQDKGPLAPPPPGCGGAGARAPRATPPAPPPGPPVREGPEPRRTPARWFGRPPSEDAALLSFRLL